MCSLYFNYLPMKRYSFCITFTPTTYATSDKTIIRHVYKPDFAVCVPFSSDRKLGPVCHQIGGRVRSSFLSGQCFILSTNKSLLVSRLHSYSLGGAEPLVEARSQFRFQMKTIIG